MYKTFAFACCDRKTKIRVVYSKNQYISADLSFTFEDQTSLLKKLIEPEVPHNN